MLACHIDPLWSEGEVHTHTSWRSVIMSLYSKIVPVSMQAEREEGLAGLLE